MITYKITSLFSAEWDSLYPALFGNNEHCASIVGGNVGEFSFESDSVTPANLGPLVIVETITKSEQQ
jgi:hypothetical protein